MSRHRKSATSVYVRNLHHEVRQDDLKKLFSKYGDIGDIYVPLDYFTREPRGFAYIQFDDRDEAEDAIHDLDGTNFFGRNIEVLMAQGDRKTPGQMRYKDGGGRRGGRKSYSRSRSRSRSPRRRRRSRSRSPSPSSSRSRRGRSRSFNRSRSRSREARRRSYSRSRSPAPR